MPPYRKQRSPPRTSEFEILKASHRFLREDDQAGTSEETWDDSVAKRYEASLYREFAVCDLKHYKSANFGLRWRTEHEVLHELGESTCGNTRCAHYDPSRENPDYKSPPLTTLELPFAYEEGKSVKTALVKTVLCKRCLKKLMWSRNKGKQRSELNTEERLKSVQ